MQLSPYRHTNRFHLQKNARSVRKAPSLWIATFAACSAAKRSAAQQNGHSLLQGIATALPAVSTRGSSAVLSHFAPFVAASYCSATHCACTAPSAFVKRTVLFLSTRSFRGGKKKTYKNCRRGKSNSGWR